MTQNNHEDRHAYVPQERPVRDAMTAFMDLSVRDATMLALSAVMIAGYATGALGSLYAAGITLMSHNESNQATWLATAFKSAVVAAAGGAVGRVAHLAARAVRGPKPAGQ